MLVLLFYKSDAQRLWCVFLTPSSIEPSTSVSFWPALAPRAAMIFAERPAERKTLLLSSLKTKFYPLEIKLSSNRWGDSRSLISTELLCQQRIGNFVVEVTCTPFSILKEIPSMMIPTVGNHQCLLHPWIPIHVTPEKNPDTTDSSHLWHSVQPFQTIEAKVFHQRVKADVLLFWSAGSTVTSDCARAHSCTRYTEYTCESEMCALAHVAGACDSGNMEVRMLTNKNAKFSFRKMTLGRALNSVSKLFYFACRTEQLFPSTFLLSQNKRTKRFPQIGVPERSMSEGATAATATCSTVPVYFQDTYLFSFEDALITRVEQSEEQPDKLILVTDKTILHPQGGKTAFTIVTIEYNSMCSVFFWNHWHDQCGHEIYVLFFHFSSERSPENYTIVPRLILLH